MVEHTILVGHTMVVMDPSVSSCTTVVVQTIVVVEAPFVVAVEVHYKVELVVVPPTDMLVVLSNDIIPSHNIIHMFFLGVDPKRNKYSCPTDKKNVQYKLFGFITILCIYTQS